MSTVTWHEANHRQLVAALDRLEGLLRAHAAREMGEASPAVEQWPVWTGPAEQLSGIDCLTQALSLSPFERDVLLLAAAPALDGRFPSLIAQANGSQALLSPTFSLALAALPDGHWSAITPDGALRKWRLIAPLTGPVHTLAPLVAEEQIWHFLLGIASTEPTVAALLVPPVQDRLLLPGQAAVAEQIVHLLSEGETHRVQLVGATTADRAQVVAAVARRLDARVAQVRVQALPTQDPELAEFQVRLRREFIFRTSFLHLELDDLDSQERPQRVAVERLIQDHQGVLLLTGPSRTDMGSLSSLIVPLPARQPHEQRAAWHRLLASELVLPDEDCAALATRLAGTFDLDLSTMHIAVAQAQTTADPIEGVWEACRNQARPRLSSLAQRVQSAANWQDLVLPPNRLETLREIALRVRHRMRVMHDWGMGERMPRGRGTVALFSGPSGTGKTLAAEVLGNELGLDVWRIDLSAVMSKWIGETEKNLRRIFDAAESGGVVLLFDEADALFGKRTQVNSSHDRHANLETGYLLQRLEAFRGLAILTTNLKSSLDPAFQRRLSFMVEFPMPDKLARIRIWQTVFSSGVATEGLLPERLAQLNLTGAVIRNLALRACFLAAAQGPDTAVTMAHLREAAVREYRMSGQPLSDLELDGWT